MWFSWKLRRLRKALHQLLRLHRYAERVSDDVEAERMYEKLVYQGKRVAKLMVAETPVAQTSETKQRRRRRAGHKPVRKETRPYTAQSFWDKFDRDLISAKHYIVFVCPFIGPKRWSKLLPHLKRILNKGVELVFHTRRRDDLRKSDNEEYKNFVEQVFEWFRRDGVTTIEESGIHQKIVLIDGRILWCGSLNVLSHVDTHEVMLRITDPHLIRSIVEQHNIELPPLRRGTS